VTWAVSDLTEQPLTKPRPAKTYWTIGRFNTVDRRVERAPHELRCAETSARLGLQGGVGIHGLEIRITLLQHNLRGDLSSLALAHGSVLARCGAREASLTITADALCASTRRGCRGGRRVGSEAKVLGDDSLRGFGGHRCSLKRKAGVMSPESETAGHETCLKEHLLVRWPQICHVKECKSFLKKP